MPDDILKIFILDKFNLMDQTQHLLSTKSNRKRLEEAIKQLENDEVIRYNDPEDE